MLQHHIGWAALILAAGTWSVTLSSIWLAARRIGTPKAAFLSRETPPPVTIIRPLCGRERFSEETLRSGFVIDHPDYELIFCVASSADPIIPLVERLIADHGHIRSRLLVGDDRISANPKLNNCVKGWEAGGHDWVILADSNVLMPKNYVARLLSAWRANTGLVCSAPIGTRPAGFWALVECAFLNTLQARWQYAAEALGLGFAQGKSMLWYRPFLNRRGGVRALAADIAEDAAATKLVREAGLHVHLVDQPFEQPLGRRGAGEVWARQLRWSRLRRVTFPVFFLPEILSTPLIAAATLSVASPSPLVAAALVGLLLTSWYGGELWLAHRAGWTLSWRLPLAFAVRDLLILPLWTCAIVARNVVWRGNAMNIVAPPSIKLADLR